jgi:dedicator of cytokinesis protein 1
MNKFSHNLLVSVHNFVCKLNEDTELLFTLYDGEAMKPITENYLVRWNRQGIASSYFSNIRVLFTDLSSRDLERNKIYLVAYVVRIGGMDIKGDDSRRVSVASSVLSKRNSMQSQHSSSLNLNELMRRPFGVAAFDLTPIIKKADDFKSDTQLSMPFIQCEKETLDQTLKKLINNKEMGKDGSNIWISVELLHGDLKQLKEEYPHLIHGSISHARKMGFPEVIFPGDVRNDLYVTLTQAEFSKSVGKATDRNIEVIVSVCTDEGQVMEKVISQGGGSHMTSEYHSVIYYHEDRPKWNETFKVYLPIDDFRKCHLKFMFKHRSSNETKDKNEKPFALAFVKLQQENGTTLQQGLHNLVVYKLDYKKYDEKTAFNYYSLPSRTFELSTVSKPAISGYTIAIKDTFVVDINLCSTKLTQDLNLLGLFKWQENPENLQNSLTQLLQVKPEEIVKFLQDILDALFDILVNNKDPILYDDLVFQCLVLLIEIVNDKKYQHFQSVLELYINDSFSWTNAYDKLIHILERHFVNALSEAEHGPKGFVSETSIGDKLYKTTKNMQYIMKFIIQSRILYAKMFEDRNKFAFETRLDDLLGQFVALIALKEPLLKSQGAILKYLHVITSDLMEIYDPLKLR